MLIEVWYLWVIAGLVLWIVEMYTSGFVVGIFGTACLIVAPVARVGTPFRIQVLVFVVGTAVLSFAIRPLVLKYLYDRRLAKTNVDALIGKVGFVTVQINERNGTGNVRIGGEEWRAAASAGELTIEVGERVVVEKIDGAKLIVKPIN
jgi:membrane protein implicated in regulation of membrane protease activity